MTPEETYEWVGRAMKLAAKCKADMVGQIRTSTSLDDDQLAQLEEAIDHELSVEILRELGRKLRTGEDAEIYGHPCRDCGQPFTNHPHGAGISFPACEAWT